MGVLTASEISSNLFAICKSCDRMALHVRTIEEALDDLIDVGAGTTVAARIDASGSRLLEGKLGNQATNDLDSWLIGQSGDYIYAHRLLKNWMNDLYAYARAHLADIGEASSHGDLIENLLGYYGLRLPQYFCDLAWQSQGKNKSLGPDVVFPDGGMDDDIGHATGLQKNLLATVTGIAGPAITAEEVADCPLVATPAALQWKCTATIAGGDLKVAIGNAYGQSDWSAADAAACGSGCGFTIANGVTEGTTGDLFAAGTGAAAISTASTTLTNLGATACTTNMTLTTQIQLASDEDAVQVTFTIAGAGGTLGAGDTLNITGTDENGDAQSENIDVSAGNGVYTGANTWATITDIDCAGWADGTLAVTQPIQRDTSLTLGANETDAFYASATAYQKALIVGVDADSGVAVSFVVIITSVATSTVLICQPIRFNIETGYSIFPMYHSIDTLTSDSSTATAGAISIYPKDDRTLEW